MRRATASIARHACRRRLHAATAPPVEITTLPNKIRVATESTPGHFSSLGLYIDAGARYETPQNLGVSHFLDRLAFKNTATRTEGEMQASIDRLGGQILCASSRESIMYQSSHFHQETPLAMSIIADTALNASFLPEEIEAQRDAAHYELREMRAKPDMIIPEIMHEVAYGGTGLGNPILCPEERISAMDMNTLRSTMQAWYRPERMVIAGAGMAHAELVELTDKYFSSLKAAEPDAAPLRANSLSPPPPLTPPHLLTPSPPSIMKSLTRAASYLYPNPDSAELPPSLYTGGHRFIHDTESELDHLYLAFEGFGIHDPDIYTLATMQVLLGGGGSFSAGGPGKGMYSRLYTHILNHFPQVDHCASYHHIYADSSLFGLFASYTPHGSSASQIFPHLVHQLSLMLYQDVPGGELQRAKNQLKSGLMMALESRAVEVEDLGRQILVHNRKVSVEEMTEKIDEITQQSVRKVAERVFGLRSGRKATVVCLGKQDIGDWTSTLKKYAVAY